MLAKNIHEVESFVAGDETVLKEIWHPERDNVSLPFSIATAFLEPGKSSLPHVLTQKEVYIFMSGQGKIRIESESLAVGVGSTVIVPERAVQQLTNTGNDRLEFICLVAPPWAASGEFILDVRNNREELK